MLKPEDVLNDIGMRELNAHLFNMEEALFFLINHEDDLHIGYTDDRQIAVIYELRKLLPTYRDGDGETEDDSTWNGMTM